MNINHPKTIFACATSYKRFFLAGIMLHFCFLRGNMYGENAGINGYVYVNYQITDILRVCNVIRRCASTDCFSKKRKKNDRCRRQFRDGVIGMCKQHHQSIHEYILCVCNVVQRCSIVMILNQMSSLVAIKTRTKNTIDDVFRLKNKHTVIYKKMYTLLI